MDTMSTQTPAHVEESKSYFEKNKKMIVLLIIMLLIFCGLMTYIFISTRPGTPVVNNTVTPLPQPTPVVPQPIVSIPTPDQPSQKEISFDINSNQFGPSFIPQITLTVPADSTTVVTNTNQVIPTVEVSNSDFKLIFGVPYEINGVATFKSNFVNLGTIAGIDNTVYRVESTGTTPLVGYSNSTTIESGSCTNPAQDYPINAPCGNMIVSSQMMAVSITCQANTNSQLTICDNAVKSMSIVKKDK